MPKLDDLQVDETNSTYSAWYWDKPSHSWKQYLHQDKYRYFWPNAIHDVVTILETNYPNSYRIYRHDTTRTV